MNKAFWDKVEALEALAKQATPGPWEVSDFDSGVNLAYEPDHLRTQSYGCDNRFVCDLNDGEYHKYESKEEQKANAQFIAAANPAAILEMIEKFKSRLAYLEHKLVEQDIVLGNSKKDGFVSTLQGLADRFDDLVSKARDADTLQMTCLGFSAYLHGVIAGVKN